MIEAAHAPNLRWYQVVLRDKKGSAVRDDYYWINIMLAVRLLDQTRSKFTRTLVGGVRSVEQLVLLRENVPDEELFLFHELALPVTTRKLKSAIEEAGLTGMKFEPLDGLPWPT